MIIRILEETDIPNAAGLSRYVFDVSLRNRMEFVQTIEFVEKYLQAENLLQMTKEQKLVIWGVFEGEQLVAVSGLSAEGMITMLYVLPQCTNRGYGSTLVGIMLDYARNVYGHSFVVVNATPAWTSNYFLRHGFVKESMDLHVPFVTMRAPAGKNPLFEKKPVPAGVMIGAAIGCFVLATIVCVAYLIWYTS